MRYAAMVKFSKDTQTDFANHLRRELITKLWDGLLKKDGKGKKVILTGHLTVRVFDKHADNFLRNEVTVLAEHDFKQYRVPRILNRKHANSLFKSL